MMSSVVWHLWYACMCMTGVDSSLWYQTKTKKKNKQKKTIVAQYLVCYVLAFDHGGKSRQQVTASREAIVDDTPGDR